MGFFGTISDGFHKTFDIVETPFLAVEKAEQDVVGFVKKHPVEVGLGVAIAAGAVLTVATGGLFAPVEAELIGAEAVAVGGVALAEAGGIEVGLGGFAAVEGAGIEALGGEVQGFGIGAGGLPEVFEPIEEAVGVFGRDIAQIGSQAELDALNLLDPVGAEFRAFGGVVVEEIGGISEEVGAVAEEVGEGFLGGLGRVGNSVGRLGTQFGGIVKGISTGLGVIGTIGAIGQGIKEAAEEKDLIKKIKAYQDALDKAAALLKKQQAEEKKDIEDVKEDVKSIKETEAVELGQIKSLGAQIKGLRGLEEKEIDAINSLSENQQEDREEIRNLDKDIQDLKQQEASDRLQEQHFESKLLARVEQEESELVGVIDDLAERLEESELKPLDFNEFNSLMQRLEADDILDFLSRNQSDFNKLSKSQKNQLIDLAILKGL